MNFRIQFDNTRIRIQDLLFRGHYNDFKNAWNKGSIYYFYLHLKIKVSYSVIEEGFNGLYCDRIAKKCEVVVMITRKLG